MKRSAIVIQSISYSAVVLTLFISAPSMAQLPQIPPAKMEVPKLKHEKKVKKSDKVDHEKKASRPSNLAAPAVFPKVEADDPTIAEVKEREVHLSGRWNGEARKITLKLKNTPIIDAIRSICEKTGLGLLVDEKPAITEPSISLLVQRKPAREVLLLLIKQAHFSGVIENDILTLSAQTTPLQPAASKHKDNSILIAPPTIPAPFDESSPVLDDKMQPTINYAQKKDRVKIGRSMRIESGEVVTGSAIVVGGSLRVAGTVMEDAVAVGGNLKLEPGAIVHGEATSVGGEVEVDPKATVHGGHTSVDFGLLFDDEDEEDEENEGGYLEDDLKANATWIIPGIASLFGVVGILGVLLRWAVLFTLSLLIVVMAPQRVRRIQDYLTEKTGASTLGGLLIFLGTVPLILVLAITVLGIPLIPVVVIFVFAIELMGLVVLLSLIGEKVPLFRKHQSPIIALFLGAAVLLALDLIPYVGGILIFIGCTVASGATLLSRFGSEQSG